MQESEKPVTTMDEILHPGQSSINKYPEYPNAPSDWSPQAAEQIAAEQGIQLSNDHHDLIRALQQYFARHSHQPINLRELHDALDERFHARGGLKFLYEITPGGPVAQGCLLSGLEAPAGSTDKSYGSVV